MKGSKLVSILIICLMAGGLLFAAYAYAGEPKLPKNARNFEFAVYPSWVFLFWAIGLALHWLLLASFPNRTERLTTLFEHSPWKSLLIGIVNVFVLAFLIALTQEHAKPISVILAFIAAILLFVGIHGRSRALGRKILRAAGHEPGAFAEIMVGHSAVAFLCAIPYLGWIVLAAYYYAGGLGAVTLSFFSKPAAKEGVDLDSHL